MRIPVPSTLLAVALAALVAVGCVQYEETIEFHADGSGSVAMRLYVPVETLAALRTDSVASGPDMLNLLNERQLEDRLRVEGVSIDRLERVGTDSGIVVLADYGFEDLEAFRRTRNAGRDGAMTEVEDGVYEVTMVVASGAPEADRTTDSGKGDADTSDVAIASGDPLALRRALRTYCVRYSIEMPTPIISTPGGRLRGRSAVFEWSFAEHGIAALQPRAIRVIFRRGDLRWPTFEALRRDEAEMGANTDSWDIVD